MNEMEGLKFFPGRLSPEAQRTLLAEIVAAGDRAPFFTPRMPRTGKPFSVSMSNRGPLGWVADRDGYRYQPRHPDTGAPWPPMPQSLIDLWAELTAYPAPPEACLVNFYRPGARMGLHRDEDEAAMDAPILSVSLGDAALFRIGGPGRGDRTRSFKLSSGDVLVLSGASRGFYHGIDRLYAGSSTLLSPWPDLFPEGGRINLTLRRVTIPA